MGLIFDTSEFVAAERTSRPLIDILSTYPSSEELGISVVTIAELQHGIRRAQSSTQLEHRRRVFEDALAIFKVHDFTAPIAMRVGDLDAALAMRGERTDFADLIMERQPLSSASQS